MKKEEKKMFQSYKVDSEKNNQAYSQSKIVEPNVSSKDMPTDIIEAHGKNYLGEVISELPDNVFLNKVKTGCGLTSLALECIEKTVISVPYKNLIESKEKWCREKGIDH